MLRADPGGREVQDLLTTDERRELPSEALGRFRTGHDDEHGARPLGEQRSDQRRPHQPRGGKGRVGATRQQLVHGVVAGCCGKRFGEALYQHSAICSLRVTASTGADK
jgi:hypothetical protein